MSGPKKVKLGTTIAAGVLSVIVIAVITSRSQSSNVETRVAPVAVEVTPVTTGTLIERVSAVGTLSAMQDVVVGSETAGRITHVYVNVGDFARKGQTLVQVDAELKAIAVDQANAQMLAAETNYQKTKSDNERAEHLFANGDISSTEMETYRLAFRSGQAAYKSAEVALRFAQRQLDDTKIKAPISGYVVSRKVDVGEMVSPGMEIANIVDLSSVKVKLYIPEEEIGMVKLKQPAVLRVDSEPDRVFNSVVYSVGRKTESPAGHAYPVEVVVRNKNVDVLKAGMFARVEIETRSAADALIISKESLVNEHSNPAVYVVENNTARLRVVKLGIRSGSSVQVLKGVREGDLVISFGQKKLKDGSPVQYRNVSTEVQ
jgi:RND family efflux transporter MFP subunit